MQNNSEPDEVTKILNAVSAGDSNAANQLFPLVYDELRGIAGRLFSSRKVSEKTIQPTILVHDVFMKLSRNTDIKWESRSHFFAIAAKATRDLLVDHARRHQAAKRGGNWKRLTLSGLSDLKAEENMIAILDLESALNELGGLSPRQEKIVEMRFYAGLTVEEVAAVLGISARTVMYDWRMARAWLRAKLG